MNFEQLLYVEVLTHCKSINEAADTLHISKSGLSSAINDLENELGIKLFNRSYGGTTLSKAGQQLLPSITNILSSKNKLESTVSAIKDDTNQHVIRVQYVNTLLEPLIGEYMLDYTRNNLNKKLNVSCHHADKIIKNVRDKRIEAGLIAVNLEEDKSMIDGLKFSPICQSRFTLFVGPQNAFYSKESIDNSDIQKMKFCLYDDPLNEKNFDRLQMICGPLNVLLRVNDNQTILQTIKDTDVAGLGRDAQTIHSLWPAIRVMKKFTLTNLIPDKFTFGILTHPENNITEESQAFLTGLIEKLRAEIQ